MMEFLEEIKQTKSAHCPGCKFFRVDCNPDPEEYDLPCDAYEPSEEGEIQ